MFMILKNRYHFIQKQVRSAIRINSNQHITKTLLLRQLTPQLTQHGNQQMSTKVDDNYRLVYEGPLTKNIKHLKLVLLFTATSSILFVPAAFYVGKESVSTLAKTLVSGTALTIGVSTTMLLHWVTRVYVNKLYFDAERKMFIAETFSLFGLTSMNSFHVGDVEIPAVESAFSTFKASGRKYFIHLEFKEAEQVMSYIREFNYERDIAVK